MNRTFHAAVESLEGKALLTASSLMGSAGLVYSLSAVQFQSVSHQDIELTLTITNTSAQLKSFNYSPSMDGFVAKQNGRVVWESNAGPNALFITTMKLAPGQSTKVSEIWDETSNVGTSKMGTSITGQVTFANEMAPGVEDVVTVKAPVIIPANYFSEPTFSKKK